MQFDQSNGSERVPPGNQVCSKSLTWPWLLHHNNLICGLMGPPLDPNLSHHAVYRDPLFHFGICCNPNMPYCGQPFAIMSCSRSWLCILVSGRLRPYSIVFWLHLTSIVNLIHVSYYTYVTLTSSIPVKRQLRMTFLPWHLIGHSIEVSYSYSYLIHSITSCFGEYASTNLWFILRQEEVQAPKTLPYSYLGFV